MRRYWIAALTGVLLALQLGHGAWAQTTSMEQLREEAKAQARRELNLDTSTAARKAQATVTRQNANPPDMMDAISGKNGDVFKVAAGGGIVAVIILIILFWKPKKKEKKKRGPDAALEEAAVAEAEAARVVKKPQPEQEEPKPDTAIDIYDKIERLQKLKEKGAITEAEYADKKKQLLDRI